MEPGLLLSGVQKWTQNNEQRARSFPRCPPLPWALCLTAAGAPTPPAAPPTSPSPPPGPPPTATPAAAGPARKGPPGGSPRRPEAEGRMERHWPSGYSPCGHRPRAKNPRAICVPRHLRKCAGPPPSSPPIGRLVYACTCVPLLNLGLSKATGPHTHNPAHLSHRPLGRCSGPRRGDGPTSARSGAVPTPCGNATVGLP